jgi:histidinol phosphatase-like PHP family hydrolase
MDKINSASGKFKYDTHVHTCEGSACAVSTGAEIVRAYYEAGYSGIIITDHFFNGNTAVPQNLPWEERVELFCSGYENALEEAKNLPFSVFFGWEYTDRGMDFLTYGLGKDFLLSYPDMLSWPIEKYLTVARQHGGFISQAHPFREVWYIKEIRVYPEYVDAIEVWNASHINPKFDERAFELAKKYSLYQTAGSDTHDSNYIFGGGMEFDRKLESIEDFIQAVKEQGVAR